ncbi:carnitine/acyl carnitine carrier [Ephemerocybe angulata]|uniref:Carnitine/acyl carnitine carrier n=1 Tax=Ephemerocybe angulata TaxID=980116 RepID=A0A8H6I3C9_9AGAR|nr:carnitine/acyl carnitine carrier [Tulosesus angulatus]
MGGAANGGEKVQLDPTLDFVAGTIAGMTSLAVGFPFDTVKVRFQSPTIAGRYSSTWNALATIVREERFFGLYKGIMSPLASVALMNGLVFASYRFLMKMQLESAESVPTLYQIALAGAGSGIISSLITTPTELIKIRQQSLLTRTTARQVAWQIFRENGVRGLYRGITATALRDIGYGAYFFAYEATCRWFVSPPSVDRNSADLMKHVEESAGQLSWGPLMVAGGVAGVAGWVFTFPFDVVKTRIQASHPIYATHGPGVGQAKGAAATALASYRTPLLGAIRLFSSGPKDLNPYRSTWSTIVHSYKAEGPRVFFRGLSPTLIRAIPVNMVTFGTFEAVVRAFS